MNSITSTILGVVQGLTEFLPISSSGHLVLFQNLLGFKEPELLLDTSLHLGTLLAVCIYFFSDLKKMIDETWHFLAALLKGETRLKNVNDSPYVSLSLWVIVGTIPTGIIGVCFKDQFESLFGSVYIVGFMLLVTGLILIIPKFLPKDYSNRNTVGLVTALIVGIAQGMAIIPGISRSGTTIICGLLCRMDRELAARFSFLLSIPAILGAMVLQLGSNSLENVNILPLISGFIFSALVGLAALKVLMMIVKKGNLAYFAPYCWGVGLLVIFS